MEELVEEQEVDAVVALEVVALEEVVEVLGDEVDESMEVEI